MMRFAANLRSNLSIWLAVAVSLAPAAGWASAPIPRRTRIVATSLVLGALPPLGDFDDDGVPDLSDVYPADPTESADFDGDGIGDNADTDDDNDGVADIADAFPTDPGETLDTDADGVGNNADPDDDNDGTLDVDDGAPTNQLEDSLFARRQGIRRVPQAQCDVP